MDLRRVKSRLEIALSGLQILAFFVGTTWAFYKFGWEAHVTAPLREPQLTLSAQIQKQGKDRPWPNKGTSMAKNENGQKLIPLKVTVKVKNESKIRVSLLADWFFVEGYSITAKSTSVTEMGPREYLKDALNEIGSGWAKDNQGYIPEGHKSQWHTPRYYTEDSTILDVFSVFPYAFWVDPSDTEIQETIVYVPSEYDFIRLTGYITHHKSALLVPKRLKQSLPSPKELTSDQRVCAKWKVDYHGRITPILQNADADDKEAADDRDTIDVFIDECTSVIAL